MFLHTFKIESLKNIEKKQKQKQNKQKQPKTGLIEHLEFMFDFN